MHNRLGPLSCAGDELARHTGYGDILGEQILAAGGSGAGGSSANRPLPRLPIGRVSTGRDCKAIGLRRRLSGGTTTHAHAPPSSGRFNVANERMSCGEQNRNHGGAGGDRCDRRLLVLPNYDTSQAPYQCGCVHLADRGFPS